MGADAHNPLRLLPALPTASVGVPDFSHAYDDRLRRPGELHEAVPLPPRAGPVVERAAAAAGLPSGTAARLLIEAALVRVDLAAIGQRAAESRLDAAAAGAVVCRRLSAAESDYVCGLRRGRTTDRTVATVPVRLIGRLAEVDLEVALAGDLPRAVGWEVAAVLSGRTMLEWALITTSAPG
jgi:hypothetical protein